jgi:hypothetical protein
MEIKHFDHFSSAPDSIELDSLFVCFPRDNLVFFARKALRAALPPLQL